MDSRGLWVDLDIAYSGSCMVSMETKVNLWRLGKGEKFDREMTDLTPLKKETKDRSVSWLGKVGLRELGLLEDMGQVLSVTWAQFHRAAKHKNLLSMKLFALIKTGLPTKCPSGFQEANNS